MVTEPGTRRYADDLLETGLGGDQGVDHHDRLEVQLPSARRKRRADVDRPGRRMDQVVDARYERADTQFQTAIEHSITDSNGCIGDQHPLVLASPPRRVERNDCVHGRYDRPMTRHHAGRAEANSELLPGRPLPRLGDSTPSGESKT